MDREDRGFSEKGRVGPRICGFDQEARVCPHGLCPHRRDSRNDAKTCETSSSKDLDQACTDRTPEDDRAAPLNIKGRNNEEKIG